MQLLMVQFSTFEPIQTDYITKICKIYSLLLILFNLLSVVFIIQCMANPIFHKNSIIYTVTNSVDLDLTAPKEQSDQALPCLSTSHHIQKD